MEKEYLLEKWVKGTLSEEETKQFQESDDYPFYKAIIEDAACFKASRFSTAPDFKTLHGKLPTKKKNNPGILRNPWYLRIASVFVIGVSLYFMFFYQMVTNVTTGVGEKITIELPDASTVLLNASSQVRYVQKEWDKKRQITLQGEAFFDVAKGATFDVVTAKGTITVLGTEFNVRQRGTALEVICYEGKVRVAAGEITEILLPGDQLFLADGKILQRKTKEQTPSWTRNVSSFEERPFGEVLKELERQYNIQIRYEIKGQESILFTGGFEHGNLENAVRSIAEPMDLNFTIENNIVTLTHREK
jgi:ferric-dicitrate binding protein FerR (iron transport regulator)